MISPNFTVDDIREVRRQLDEETQGMTSLSSWPMCTGVL